jgi:Na+-driven multidrug efflux pump
VQVLPLLALLMFTDGINAVMSGVLRGSGRQRLGATINILGYWWVAAAGQLCHGC